MQQLTGILALLLLAVAACKRDDPDPPAKNLHCPADESPLRGDYYFLPSGFSPNGTGTGSTTRCG